jgi:hypothetical protein
MAPKPDHGVFPDLLYLKIEREKQHLNNFLFEIHSRFEGAKKLKPSFTLYQLTFGLDR